MFRPTWLPKASNKLKRSTKTGMFKSLSRGCRERGFPGSQSFNTAKLHPSKTCGDCGHQWARVKRKHLITNANAQCYYLPPWFESITWFSRVRGEKLRLSGLISFSLARAQYSQVPRETWRIQGAIIWEQNGREGILPGQCFHER